MWADTIHDSDQRNGDNDSLFGSPPSSPVRGRSPALALPNGEYCTQNVGTIALPGSHNFIELPVNTPALSLSGFSRHELSQRPPAANTSQMQSRPQVEPQVRTLPTRSNSSQSMRGGKKKKSSGENSSAPRLPPPIHLPDPNVPPPPNFLRNQQALLGIAGLIGRVHPANLSVPRHTRGSNASNPIIVEDVLNPPSLGRQDQPADIDPSLPPPSNEEIVASLIREKNIFPVLESILKLIASNARSTTPKGHDNRDGSRRPVTKRRKIDGVPAGATDWDVPFPFMDGEGPQADWKKMRGEQLIAQLVSLIKSAARKASSRTYERQHVQPRRYQQPPRQQQQLGSVKQQESESKIMGHYRPITATYGRPGAQIPEVLADQSNISGSNAQASPSPPYEEPLAFQPFPSSISNAGTQSPTPFDEMFSSLLAGSLTPSSGPGDDGQSTSGWSGGTATPSEISTQDIDQNAFDNWLSILNAFPDPALNSVQPSTSSDGYDIDSLVSSLSTGFPMQDNSSLITHDNIYSAGDSTTSSTNMNPDFAIDPVLLAMTVSAEPSPLDFDALPSQPTLTTSPIESGSSTAEPLTPQVEISTLEPEIYTGEQGMSIEAAQDLFVAQMVANQDPMIAASTLLQFASTSAPSSSNPATYVTASSAVEHAPTTGFSSLHQTAPRLTYDFFQQPELHRGSSNAPTEGQAAPPLTRTFQVTPGLLRSMPTANKQDILTRARERRRQLVGEIDRAKVELWETTIEQGVLAQFVKEKL
jgi:hypothetical protein